MIEDFNLSETDIEDWHGFLCEELCIYIGHGNSCRKEDITRYLSERCNEQSSNQIPANANPIGLIRR